MIKYIISTISLVIVMSISSGAAEKATGESQKAKTEYQKLFEAKDDAKLVRVITDEIKWYNTQPGGLKRFLTEFATFPEDRRKVHHYYCQLQDKATAIFKASFPTPTTIPTQELLLSYLSLCMKMTPDGRDRGIAYMMIDQLRSHITAFINDKSCLKGVLGSTGITSSSDYLTQLGCWIMEGCGDGPFYGIGDKYCGLASPFLLYGISKARLPIKVEDVLDLRITTLVNRSCHTDRQSLEEKIVCLERTLFFIEKCGCRDIYLESLKGDFLFLRGSQFPQERFSYFCRAIEVFEPTKTAFESGIILYAYQRAFASAATLEEREMILDKFHGFIPALFPIYERSKTDEDTLILIPLCNTLLCTYIVNLKLQDPNARDERVEAFIASEMQAQERRKRETQQARQKKKANSKQKHVQNIMQHQEAERDRAERQAQAKQALEELHRSHMSQRRRQAVAPAPFSEAAQVESLSSQRAQAAETKREARKILERAECKEQKRQARAPQQEEEMEEPVVVELAHDNSPESLLAHFPIADLNPLVDKLAGNLEILELFFNREGRNSWNNTVCIKFNQLKALVIALGGKLQEDRGKGGHFMVFFKDICAAELFNPHLALSQISGSTASLASVIKLWDDDLPPYLIEQLRNIFIAQKMVPRSIFKGLEKLKGTEEDDD
ncbi:MAG: cell envelope integrity protein TolA [Alphaproteobacteria bacterium]|jgi:hypothetical protein|nr:cell envelope integrity protein TolA [Alphaproteobacteria bacterium]